MVRLIALLLLSIFVGDATACNRCGLFGNRCRYYYPQRVVVQAAVPVIQQPDIFVIQNSYPSPILAQQGSTVYGYQQASSPYAVNPAELFRQASEFSRAAVSTSQIAITGYNQLANTQLQLQAQLSEPLLRSQAAIQVLSAAGLSQPYSNQQSSLSLRIYQDGGQWRIEQADTSDSRSAVQKNSPVQANSPIQADSRQLAPQVKGQSQQSIPPTHSIIASKCYKCHSAQSVAVKGELYLDRAINGEILREAIIRLKSNDPKVRMPPDGGLTPGEAASILDELLELSAPPAQQLPVEDVPPAPTAQPLQN